MNTLYHSLIKVITRAIASRQAGHRLPSEPAPQDFHEFMSKIKSNTGRFRH